MPRNKRTEDEQLLLNENEEDIEKNLPQTVKYIFP